MSKKNFYRFLKLMLIIAFIPNYINAQRCTPPPSFTGRIAWTADGNDDDRDEYTALPFMAAILQAANQKLVHLAYNDNLSGNRAGLPGDRLTPPRPRPDIMRQTVNRANRVYNSLGDNIFDCDGSPTSQGTRDGLKHLSDLIRNASSGTRLFICIAGQAQYVGMALEMATTRPNPATRADFRNVTIVSHSAYNNRNGLGQGTYSPEWNITNIENASRGGLFDGLRVANYATRGSVHNDNLLVDISRYNFLNNNRRNPFVAPIITGFRDTRKGTRLDPSDAGMAYMVLYNTNAITLANASNIEPADFDQEIRDLASGDPSCGTVLSIADVEKEAVSLKVYPNPTTKSVILEINNNSVNINEVKTQLTDVKGSIVTTKNAIEGSNKLVINTENLQKGVYFLNAVFNTSNLTKKIIVE